MERTLRSALQALSVAQWMLTFLFLGPGSALALLWLLRTRLWIVPVTYAGWWLWDWHGADTGPRHWDWLRNWRIWDHFCDYFPITVIRECPLPPGRSYILPAHPHGISCIGVFGAFVTGGCGAWGDPNPSGGPCPGLRPNLAALEGLFRLPLYREYAMAAGLCPVSQRCLDSVLSRPSQALLIVVGGAAEALEGTPGRHRVTLRQRRGFVRLALRHGAPLVPVYVFGEQDAFQQPPLAERSLLRRLQRGLKRILGFAPCLFWGRGGLPVLPFRVPLTVVVGTPLEVPRVPRPSPELVAHYHELYVQRLQELFERHKVACGVSPEPP
ncbi:2-acylglycerol O-acyltransferase 3 [Ammospiza caudacuta]|uniref:2-acylglycerol O-acyltransferase 3 n=1 Tax=Ammospiza caudacuta TaxID=2857398 RepID=UPI0027398990|nr:2-acylglycerol O-acyltransferase 3 [Ammospiza caudacuta]